MTPPRSRSWHHSAHQTILLDYASLKRQCPGGIYVSPKPGNPLHWSGVLFVRKGPYAPAILLFHVAFPPEYPYLPPTIAFTTDIFHPLVTPLTTYTYTTSSEGSDTVSANDEERLPPGGFSLRHGFPTWFRRGRRSNFSSPPSSPGESKESSMTSSPALKPISVDRPDKNDSSGTVMLQVFEYMKRSFDDEAFLDGVPLEAAGNVGAWKAWRAHRASQGALLSDAMHGEIEHDEREEWKWDGVWENRVQRGIDSSISESTLFGNAPSATADEMIRFSDLDKDLLDEIKAQILQG